MRQSRQAAERRQRPRGQPSDNGEPPLATEVWDSLTPDSVKLLLAGALQTFAERGYHGTTTRDIAARARLSPAAIYVHYESKEDLLFFIMRVAHEEVLRVMREAEASDARATADDKLRAVVRAHTWFHATRYTAARIANHELPALDRRLRNVIQNLRAEVENVVRHVLQEGAESGEFEIEDMNTTVFAILSMGIGVARWFSPSGRLTPSQLGDLHGELVSRMVMPRPRP